MAGRAVARPIIVIAGGELPLKIIPARGERLPFTVRTNSLATADVTRLNNRVTANFATFTLRGRNAGETVLEIASADGARTPPIPVRIAARVDLPAEGIDIGMLTRLFLEVPTPASAEDLPDLRLAMTLMRVVIENRSPSPRAAGRPPEPPRAFRSCARPISSRASPTTPI
jgi:hypothetical protein